MKVCHIQDLRFEYNFVGFAPLVLSSRVVPQSISAGHFLLTNHVAALASQQSTLKPQYVAVGPQQVAQLTQAGGISKPCVTMSWAQVTSKAGQMAILPSSLLPSSGNLLQPVSSQNLVTPGVAFQYGSQGLLFSPTTLPTVLSSSMPEARHATSIVMSQNMSPMVSSLAKVTSVNTSVSQSGKPDNSLSTLQNASSHVTLFSNMTSPTVVMSASHGRTQMSRVAHTVTSVSASSVDSIVLATTLSTQIPVHGMNTSFVLKPHTTTTQSVAAPVFALHGVGTQGYLRGTAPMLLAPMNHLLPTALSTKQSKSTTQAAAMMSLAGQCDGRPDEATVLPQANTSSPAAVLPTRTNSTVNLAKSKSISLTLQTLSSGYSRITPAVTLQTTTSLAVSTTATSTAQAVVTIPSQFMLTIPGVAPVMSVLPPGPH